jgi:hypothetical protein
MLWMILGALLVSLSVFGLGVWFCRAYDDYKLFRHKPPSVLEAMETIREAKFLRALFVSAWEKAHENYEYPVPVPPYNTDQIVVYLKDLLKRWGA